MWTRNATATYAQCSKSTPENILAGSWVVICWMHNKWIFTHTNTPHTQTHLYTFAAQTQKDSHTRCGNKILSWDFWKKINFYILSLPLCTLYLSEKSHEGDKVIAISISSSWNIEFDQLASWWINFCRKLPLNHLNVCSYYLTALNLNIVMAQIPHWEIRSKIDGIPPDFSLLKDKV